MRKRSQPCTLMASWIALEDIVPGAGELAYYPGSHRHPLFLFNDGRIEWRHQEDGKPVHVEYTRFLQERADRIDGEPRLYYFRFFRDACRRPWRDGFYSSRRYDLRPGVENPYPVYFK